MYWSKVKTILIVLFAGINIFLLVNMIISLNQSIVISNQTINNTVEVLQKNDIIIDDQIIPRRTQNVSFLVIENAIQDTQKFVSGVLDKPYQKQTQEDRLIYTHQTKTLILENASDFIYMDTAAHVEIGDIRKQRIERYVRLLLEDLGFDIRYVKTMDVTVEDDATYTLVFEQQYTRRSIFESDIIATLSPEGKLTIVGAAWGPRRTEDKLVGRQITSVLIEFVRREDRPKDQQMTITSLSLGYFPGKDIDNFKEVHAAPVWRIEAIAEDGTPYTGIFEAIKTPIRP